MSICYSRTWSYGQFNSREKIMMFLSENDRDDYGIECSELGRSFQNIDDSEKKQLLKRPDVSTTFVMVLRNPSTGRFEELS